MGHCIQEAQSAMDEISIRTEQIPYELLQVSFNFFSYHYPGKACYGFMPFRSQDSNWLMIEPFASVNRITIQNAEFQLWHYTYQLLDLSISN